MKTVFTNGRIILADRILDGYSVIVEDGVISDVTRGNTAADKVVDLGGRYLAPGFIDMHTHGAGGHDFMDGTEEAIKGACMTHLSHGTTSIVPTTLTCLNSELFNFFEVFRKVKAGWHEDRTFSAYTLKARSSTPRRPVRRTPSSCSCRRGRTSCRSSRPAARTL